MSTLVFRYSYYVTTHIAVSPVTRCHMCTRDASSSLQKDLRRMNEHLKRIHGASAITDQEFHQLESCQAWKPSEKSSFRAIAHDESLSQRKVDFRMESVLESKVGLLKSNIVLLDGEEQKLGNECLRFFPHPEGSNPYYDGVFTFLNSANTLCNISGSEHCRQQAMRNSEGATTTLCFHPVQLLTLKKYAAIVSKFIYFATKCPWDHPTFNLTDVPSIMHSIFFEPRVNIQQNYMTRYFNYFLYSIVIIFHEFNVCHQTDALLPSRKFIQMSYIAFGSGPNSRNAQFVVHQCVAILYAMRVFFLHYCLRVLHPSRVDEPERISNLFLNSQKTSSFTSIQNIKRPAKLDIPPFGDQKITWVVDSNYTSLLVHCGVMNLDRVPVSHSLLRNTFNRIVEEIRCYLRKMAVSCITYEEFVTLKDSSSSKRPGEGMMTFNPNLQSFNKMFVKSATRECRLEFLSQASIVYRMALAAIHLSGGPSPRGTEDAVTRLTNSTSELVRNVQIVNGTMGVSSGYVTHQPSYYSVC